MVDSTYRKHKQLAEAARPFRRAAFAEYRLGDNDWLSNEAHRKARSITCYIAHHYLGAPFEVCTIVCNYKCVSRSTAWRAYESVASSPELKLMADHVYNKVVGVQVA